MESWKSSSGGEDMGRGFLELAIDSRLQKRYRITRMVGAGGFGITYEAMDELNRI